MRDGHTHYTPASGIMEVRQAVARSVTENTGVETSPLNVVLTPGSKNIIHFALLSLVSPGDEVLVPDPGYPNYASLTNFTGAVPVSVPMRESRDFRLDVEELRTLVTDRTRMIILNTPANPTGGCLTASDILAIAGIAIERDLVVLSDELYWRLIYEGEHVSPYSIPGMAERTVLIDGLSKAWAMCGWRLGMGVMPVELAKSMGTLMINTSSCTASFTQLATVEALESPLSDAAVDAMREEFRTRRDLVVEGLNRIPGVRCHRPAGAFYVFPNITGTGWNERALAHSLLHEAGVAVLPGTAFGAHGAGFLRLSYANSVPNLERALERIAVHLAAAGPAAS